MTRARVVYDDPEAMAEVEQGMSISRAAERSRDRTQAANGHAPVPALVEPMPRYDDEPWFKAKSVGSIAATKLAMVERYLREELERLASEGICVGELMGDRRVSREWSATASDGALARANAVSALIRQAITPAPTLGPVATVAEEALEK